MDLRDYMALLRPLIAERLRETTIRYREILGPVSPEAADTLSRLEAFTLGGKMMRGSLACLGYGLCSNLAGSMPVPGSKALDLAVAMELLQSGLLIHDDIMDGDEFRRGAPTIHRTYAAKARSLQNPGSDTGKLGESLAICMGDLSYFVAVELIASINTRVSALCGREIAKVCAAQMLDVEWGGSPSMPDAGDILTMYRYKTARYSFSFPLVAGVMAASSTGAGAPSPGAHSPDAAGAENATVTAEGAAVATDLAAAISALERFGEAAGIVFQLRDDDLGAFGDCEAIGKPVGSDIREGKKTLFRRLLEDRADGGERSLLGTLFGNPALDRQGIDAVLGIAKRYGIRNGIEALARKHSETARIALAELRNLSLSVDPVLFGLLEEFLAYSWSRDR